MNKPTPRTEEALIDNADLYDEGHGKSDFVRSNFARQLERELYECREKRDEFRKSRDEWASEALKARDTLTRLHYSPPPARQMHDLAMLVCRLCSQDTGKSEELRKMAMEYLERENLFPSPLREAIQSANQSTEQGPDVSEQIKPQGGDYFHPHPIP